MYKLSEEQAQSLLNYLAQQPYVKVWRLVAMVQSLEKLEEPKPEEPKPTEEKPKPKA